ncbi:hypothetical protein A9168_07495 [Macellibacteroides sp. HH-ZS]|nr:hypothetical protein A9168_07495 [Macellibacteroides sp. HH-ZS]
MTKSGVFGVRKKEEIRLFRHYYKGENDANAIIYFLTNSNQDNLKQLKIDRLWKYLYPNQPYIFY